MWFTLLMIGWFAAMVWIIYRDHTSAYRVPEKPRLSTTTELELPRFTVEIETMLVPAPMNMRETARWAKGGEEKTEQALCIYIRDTKSHYWQNRDQPPFAQISLSHPDFESEARQAKANAELRAELLSSLAES